MPNKTNQDWQEVNPDTQDMWDFRNQSTIQGLYVAKKENVGENKSNIYVLNVANEKVGVWGSVVLDSRFEQIAIGSEVKIEYLGKVESESGGRAYHNFKVFRRPAPFEEVQGKSNVGEVNEAAQIASQEVKEEEIPVIESEPSITPKPNEQTHPQV